MLNILSSLLIGLGAALATAVVLQRRSQSPSAQTETVRDVVSPEETRASLPQPQTLADFIETHRGLVGAAGLFLGVGTLAAGEDAEALAVAVFGFLGLLMLHELHERAPRSADEPLSSFRVGLFLAMAAAYSAWTVAVSRVGESTVIIPYWVLLLWVGRVARVRKWPARKAVDAILGLLFVLGLPVFLAEVAEVGRSLLADVSQVWNAVSSAFRALRP